MLLTRKASPPRSEKPLFIASVQGNLGISAVARQMRRIFDPRDGAYRQDVFVATAADAMSYDADDFPEWTAYRKAKKKRGKAEDGGAEKVKDKV